MNVENLPVVGLFSEIRRMNRDPRYREFKRDVALTGTAFAVGAVLTACTGGDNEPEKNISDTGSRADDVAKGSIAESMGELGTVTEDERNKKICPVPGFEMKVDVPSNGGGEAALRVVQTDMGPKFWPEGDVKGPVSAEGPCLIVPKK